MKILSEHDRTQIKKQCITILLSPPGRDLGRWFLTENGKGAEGNLGQLKREIFDVLSECVNELYASPAPVTKN